MSSRPYSWFPLAASDPVPGDPDAVQRSSERYAAVAEHIDTAATNLRTIARSADMSAQAVDAVRDRANDLAEEVKKSKGRYAAVAQALGDYARALRTAQEASADLLTRAVAAQQSIDNATTERTYATTAWWELDADATDDERRRAWTRLSSARTAVSDAEVRLQHLRAELEAIVRGRDTAAQAAIDAIGAARATDRLDDGWWEDWGADVARTVSSVAGTVAAVAGVAALFLGWVPILGQVLAGVALVAGIAALVADVALAATQEQDWTNAAVGVLGLVTFGLGRAVARGTVTLARTARSQARRAVKATLRSGSPATRATAQSSRSAVLAAPRPADLRIRDLWNAGSDAPAVYRTAWTAARQQVTSASGAQRWLALNGHGNLVEDAATLGSMTDSLIRPQAAALLTAPVQHAHRLQVGGALLYVTDATANYGSLAKTAVDVLEPPPTAAERLNL